MKRLYQSAEINGLTLKNRVVLAPMGLGNTINGYTSKRDIEFYRMRAKGGVGLIIYANVQFDPIRHNPNSGALLFDKKYVPELKKVTDAIHEERSRVFAQLMHKGRYAPRISHRDQQSVAPSAIPSKFTNYEMPREMTCDEIQDFLKWQATAAGFAVEAGFDGIEIETNSGYLFGQFFSPLVNKRTDKYGGDLQGRTRFLVETLAAVREAVGPAFPVTVRIGGNDFIPGSCTGEDICDICALLDKTGNVDAFSVTGGWHEASVPLITMELPHATYAYLGKAIKQRVGCPVMQSNRMNIPTAEDLVEHGDIDFAVMGRPFLAEPNLVNLAKNGRISEARPCIGCNAGCLDVGMQRKPTGCIGNPECNIEADLMRDGLMPTEIKIQQPENILVIGAGPAGMEFARVASLRGARVTIWEAKEKAGGQLRLAAAPPRRQDILYLGDWLERTCVRLGVKMVFGKTATEEDILAAAPKFDRVVIATGASPIAPRVPVENGADVVQAWDVLEGTADAGRNVVIIGGGAVGVETALYLAEIGTLSAEELRFMMIFDVEPYEKLQQLLDKGSKKVTVVEMQPSFGKDINAGARWTILSRVKKLGVELLSKATVKEIKENGIMITGEQGDVFIPADTVVLAVGSRPSHALYEALEGKLEKLNVIGDAGTPAKIPEAIRVAYHLAVSL